MSGSQSVREDARNAGIGPNPGVRPAIAPVPAPAPTPRPQADRFSGANTAPVDESQKLANLVRSVEARKAGLETPAAETPATEKPLAETPVAGKFAAQAPGAEPPKPGADGRDGHVDYKPPQVQRPVYTGGAPALKPDQMDAAVIKNNLLLRGLYALEEKAPWLLKAYQGFTKVAGPIGAWLNLGYNAYSAKKILSDPRAPLFLKAGVVGSTGLAGASAVAATRVGLHAFNFWPMAAEGAKAAGKFAGVTGLGAATILSAMDTYTTFRDPKSTAAERGFSLLGTGASAGLTIAVLMGVTGPVGIGLGIGAVAFTLAKGFLGKNKYANAVFEGIGKGVSAVTGAIGSAAGAVKDFAKDAAGAVAGGFKKVFSGW